MASNDVAYNEYEQTSKNKSKQTMPVHKVLQRYIPIVAINVIVILILGFFISPWSKVGTVSVEGNNAVYVQEIIDESGVRGGDSLIDTLQEREAIEQSVTDQLEQVKSTSVEVSGLNDLSIQVEEFDTVSYIAQEGSYLRVLENGVVLDDVYDVSIGNQPVLSNFEEGEALNLISEIELVESRSNPLFIQVFMNNGNRVLSSIPAFSEKIPFYPQMVQAVEGQQGVFDMEAGVYFIPFATEDGEINEDTEVDESEREALEEFTGGT